MPSVCVQRENLSYTMRALVLLASILKTSTRDVQIPGLSQKLQG